VKRSVEGIRQLSKIADIIALQETWLLPHDIPYLASIDADFGSTGTSAVDTTTGLLVGRPRGGVALLWRKSVFPCVSVIPCSSARICAIKIDLDNQKIIVCSVYMPVDCSENLVDFTDCLSYLNAIVEESRCETVFLLGDYNAHPGQPFFEELKSFCLEQNWICADVSNLDTNSFTYVSDAHGTGRWLDHFIVTKSAYKLISSTKILHDVYWSDHFPLLTKCRLSAVIPKIALESNSCNKIKWGNRNEEQIKCYTELCNENLKLINFPLDFVKCSHGFCNDL
jgi:exonuclease III